MLRLNFRKNWALHVKLIDSQWFLCRPEGYFSRDNVGHKFLPNMGYNTILHVIMSIETPSHKEILGQNCLLGINESSNYVPEFGLLTQITFHYLIIKSEVCIA